MGCRQGRKLIPKKPESFWKETGRPSVIYDHFRDSPVFYHCSSLILIIIDWSLTASLHSANICLIEP